MAPTTEQATASAGVIEQQIEAWSEMLRSGALDAVDFAKAQVPGVIQEMLAYGMAVYVMLGIVSVAILVFLTVAARRAVRRDPPMNEWNTGPLVLSACGAWVFLVPFLLFVVIPNLLKLWFAPRLYLIEEFGRILS